MTKTPARMWRNVYTLLCIGTMAMMLSVSCMEQQEEGSSDYRKLSGPTMGTQYNMTFEDPGEQITASAIDSILHAINNEVSTYIDTSTISKFNQSKEGIPLETVGQPLRYPHFQANWQLSKKVHDLSEGYFDPTVMPLVNYWGFGYTPQEAVEQIDSARVDSLLQYVGLDKISKVVREPSNRHFLSKAIAGVELDFGGIAKGYGVDVLVKHLKEHEISNYLVELGGEVRCSGQNPNGKQWTIGINTPDPEASTRSVNTILQLEEGAIATSGNYRNYHKIDGQLYGHTISPFTGFPELNKVLSASVFTGDCARADAYATAFMAMSEKKSISLANKLKDIEILLIVSEEDGGVSRVTTPGFDRFLNNNQ